MLMSAPNGAPHSRPEKTTVSHNASGETCSPSSREVKACDVVRVIGSSGFVCCDDPALGGRHSAAQRGENIPELCKEAMRCLSRDQCRLYATATPARYSVSYSFESEMIADEHKHSGELVYKDLKWGLEDHRRAFFFSGPRSSSSSLNSA
jgi:hypothetical protein